MSRRILTALAALAGAMLLIAAPAAAIEEDATADTAAEGSVLVCLPKGGDTWQIVAVTPERAESALIYEGAKLPTDGSCTDVTIDETTDTVSEPTDEPDTEPEEPDTSTDETETDTATDEPDTSTDEPDDTDTSTDDTTRDETEAEPDTETDTPVEDEPEIVTDEDEVEVLPRVQDNPDPEDEPTPELAQTGFSSGSLARYGAVLMLAGVAFVVAGGRAREVSRR